jgi:hypothetical protein
VGEQVAEFQLMIEDHLNSKMLKHGFPVISILFSLAQLGSTRKICPDLTANLTGINFTDLVSTQKSPALCKVDPTNSQNFPHFSSPVFGTTTV